MKKGKVNQALFVKNFFPDGSTAVTNGVSDSSEDDTPGSSNQNSASKDTGSLVGSLAGSKTSGGLVKVRVAEKVKHLEEELKNKIGSNFNSVRKAWLELDENYKGFITAIELAKFLGASDRAGFDFTLLEILVKLRTPNLSTRLYYRDFCAWLGSTIEPTEGFYFRHDSKKNP